jgi:hypothetical protein
MTGMPLFAETEGRAVHHWPIQRQDSQQQTASGKTPRTRPGDEYTELWSLDPEDDPQAERCS